MELTPEAQRAIGAIVAVGGRPLLVGGCVRDWLLDIPSKDIDIEVHGPVTVEQVAKALRRIGKVDEVGKSFGVLKLGGLDISFPRRDRRIGDGHTGFEIVVDQDMTVTEALERRDFTINSMAYDPITKQIIDPFLGRWDLGRKTLRHTSSHFADDPLRVLRAVQFAGRFGMELHPSTMELCWGLQPRFSELSLERVWMEWEKILTKGTLAPSVKALKNTGWDVYFPGLSLKDALYADTVVEAGTESPEHRSALLLGALFRHESPEVIRKFMRSIKAPSWLRKDTLALADPYMHNGFTLEHQVRAIARKVRVRDWLRVHGYAGGPLTQAAEAEDVMDIPQPRLLTGDDLKAAGFTPGPIFAQILTAAEWQQDKHGWKSKGEALSWLAVNHREVV